MKQPLMKQPLMKQPLMKQPWVEPLRGPSGLDLVKLKNDIMARTSRC